MVSILLRVGKIVIFLGGWLVGDAIWLDITHVIMVFLRYPKFQAE